MAGQIVAIQPMGKERWRVTVQTDRGPYELVTGAAPPGPYQPAAGDMLVLTACR